MNGSNVVQVAHAGYSLLSSERWIWSNGLCLSIIPQLFAILENSAGALDLNTSVGLGVQFTWTESREFATYARLKLEVENEYESEYDERITGTRDAMDPYVYDLYQAVRYVEEFGGEPRLEGFLS